jgi:hypothetical protein
MEMQFGELVNEVARRLSIDGTANTETRNFELTFKNGRIVTLSLLEGDTRCAVSSLICFFPEREQALRIFELMLEAHGFGYATADAVFAIDRESSKIFMFKTYQLAALDPDRLVSEMNQFAEVAARWTEAIVSGRLLADGAAPAPAVAAHEEETIIYR